MYLWTVSQTPPPKLSSNSRRSGTSLARTTYPEIKDDHRVHPPFAPQSGPRTNCIKAATGTYIGLAAVGFRTLFKLLSKIWLKRRLVMVLANKSCAVPRLSSVRDCTRETWTPISRCTPEHSIHVNMPKLVLSQVGSARTKHHVSNELRNWPKPRTVTKWLEYSRNCSPLALV